MVVVEVVVVVRGKNGEGVRDGNTGKSERFGACIWMDASKKLAGHKRQLHFKFLHPAVPLHFTLLHSHTPKTTTLRTSR